MSIAAPIFATVNKHHIDLDLRAADGRLACLRLTLSDAVDLRSELDQCIDRLSVKMAEAMQLARDSDQVNGARAA